MSQRAERRHVGPLRAEAASAHGEPAWIEKPSLERTAPDRQASNYYRGTAKDGKVIGGIPLTSAEAAVVAAVRMAYGVAEAQIDRSTRLARRLREEGDKAVGPNSPQKALDATERIVFRGVMSLLSWLEGVAADRGNPLQRFAAAQYRIAGALLGLAPGEAHDPTGAHVPDARRWVRTDGLRHDGHRDEDAAPFPVRIKHAGPDRRAVRISAWNYTEATGVRRKIPVKFYHVKGGSNVPLEGEITIAGRRSLTLTLTTPPSAPSGRWRAAFCDAEGVQVGTMEIML
jgi:hypothetical protein